MLCHHRMLISPTVSTAIDAELETLRRKVLNKPNKKRDAKHPFFIWLLVIGLSLNHA